MEINILSVRRMENPDELASVAKHTDPYVRAAVASNRHTPLHVLDELSRDSDSRVRSCVAGNTVTRLLTLVVLGMRTPVDDELMWPIFLPLAGNPTMTHREIFQRIYARKQWAECLRLVNHPSVPDDLLEKLANETNPDWEIIKQLAKERLRK